MNDYWLSLLLGIVEGITEFLPISSTAHLRITEALLHVSLTDDYWKMYSIVIQLGAVLSLPFYFRHRIAGFLQTFPRGPRGDRTIWTHPVTLVLVAFVMTAAPGFLLARVIGHQLERLTVMGWSLIVGGIVMWMVDARNAGAEARGAGRTDRIQTWSMDDMTLGQAVWIGACQLTSAVFPGTSRSMATIAAGQLAGLSRAAALEFSFFLSLPTMAAATGYDLLKALAGAGDSPIGVTRIDAHGWTVLAIGFVVSFAVAYTSVVWLMAWVRRHGFVPFAIYRLALGAGVLLYALG